MHKFDNISTYDLQKRVRELEAEIEEMQQEILDRFHKEIGVVRLPPSAPQIVRPERASRPTDKVAMSATPKRSRLADLLRSAHGTPGKDL